MIQTKLLLAAASACALLALPSQAKTALMDFGNNLGLVTSSGGLTYNAPANLAGTPKSTSAALNDTTGATTGWSVNVTLTSQAIPTNAGFSGSNYTGTLPAALSAYDTNATRDNIFFDGADGQLTVTLTGLDNSKTYDLLFYGSRANVPGTQIWELTTGSGTAPDVSHSSAGNSTTVVDWKGIAPDAGTIAFTVSVTGGVGALNFGEMVEVEPKTALLDFGNASGLSTTYGGLTYNAFHLPNNGTTSNETTGTVVLNDASGASTGWTINVTNTAGGTSDAGSAGAGATYGGTLPAQVSGFDPIAVRDNFYFNKGDQPAGELTVTLAGLDNTKTYDLLFYGSRSNLDGTLTWHKTIGTGAADDVTHSSAANSATVVDWKGLAPVGGQIAFTVSLTGTVGALNFGQVVEAVPGPDSAAMLACDFGALGQAEINEAAGTVLLTVPADQPVTSLAPTFTLPPGATIDPASGSTQDFTNPVVYRVTSQSGTIYKDYTVTVESYALWAHSGSLFILTTPDGADLPAGASVSDFPLLVRLDSVNFDFSEAQGDGNDIRFTTAAGASLSYQIEHWDPAGGTAAVWVRIPVITGDSTQEIKIYWGRSGLASASSGSSVFNSSNGYSSVLHLGDTLTDEIGTTTPANLSTTAASGLIGRARSFTSGNGINCGTSVSGLPSGAGPFSTGVWVRSSTTPTTVLGWGISDWYGKVQMQLNSPPSIRMDCFFGGAGVIGAATVPSGEWAHVVHTYQPGSTKLYVNGVLDTANTGGTTMNIPSPAIFQIGGWLGAYNYVGEMDEVRISKVSRSADWVKLEYENQKPLQTLVGGIMPSGSDFSVSPTGVTLNENAGTTLTAQAGGALKTYWILKQGDQETVLATDQLTLDYNAGRVTGDQSAVIRFKAVFAGGTQTIDVPLTVFDTIPDPEFTLVPSTTEWDGRQTMTVTASITNLAAMQAAGHGTLGYHWSVGGVAVVKQAFDGTLTLTRAQGSGAMTVTLVMDNGGAPISNSIIINVQEPASDPWLQRTPAATEKPVNGQFFARDPDTGFGTLHYNGTQGGSPDGVFLKVYKTPSGGSETLDETYRQSLVGGAYAFSAPLAAGLITYRVVYGTTTGGVDTDVASVTDLVCGDTYILQGQSNADAIADLPDNLATDNFVRTYGWTSNTWGLATRKGNDFKIGYLAMPLALDLKSSHNMPICIISGAKGGSRIDQHQANPADHYSAGSSYSLYANLLNRVANAKLTHGIRGVLWLQGENNSGGAAPTGDWDYKSYQPYFVDLAAAWIQDYPNIQRYIMFQVQPKPCAMGPKGDQLRDVQRTLPRMFSRMSILSTIGIDSSLGYLGCHYDETGYINLANLTAPLIERDFYGVVPPASVTAPNLQRAYYTNSSRNQIALEFDQPTLWNSFSTVHFYLDKIGGKVVSGSHSGNTITLQLAAASNSSTIDYVADQLFWELNAAKLIHGSNNIAALTFADVAIGPPPPAEQSAIGGVGKVELAWTAVTGATSYKVKRSTSSGGPYTPIATTTVPAFTDLSVTAGTPYFYVISAVNTIGTSSSEGLDSAQASATPLGGYAAWAANPAQGLTPGVNDGPLMDPDFDGIWNLLEFVLNSAPMTPSSSALPALQMDGGEWVFEYDRNDDSLPPATTQVVQYGSDLTGWTAIAIPITSAGAVTITPGTPTDHVRVTIPSLGGKVFARLKVTQ